MFQALPGTTATHIARAEGIRPGDLHPLTRDAAGALLGPNAALATPGTPRSHLASPHKLHVRQRLYYIEPPNGREHRRHHHRHARTELLINLPRGDIKLWLYLSEPLCQQVSAELAKARNAAAAFRLVKPLVRRATEGRRTCASSATCRISTRGSRPGSPRPARGWPPRSTSGRRGS
jgi:hypothetical protein